LVPMKVLSVLVETGDQFIRLKLFHHCHPVTVNVAGCKC